jgi:hypothetical protein
LNRNVEPEACVFNYQDLQAVRVVQQKFRTMGNDTNQWRRAIGGFYPGIQLKTEMEATSYGGDRRLAGMLFLLLVILNSVEPNPGPTSKPFASREENEVFNLIRKKEDKLVRMESHLLFTRQCLQENMIPPGFQGMKGVSAVSSSEKDLNHQMQHSAMISMAQHYEVTIPKIKEEISWDYERLRNASTLLSFQEMVNDLQVFRKKTQKGLKKTKIVKLSKTRKRSKIHSSTTSTNADCWLANLRLRRQEKKLILDGQWLTDDIMNAVGTLLKRQHPGLSGLEEVAVSGFGFDANP